MKGALAALAAAALLSSPLATPSVARAEAADAPRAEARAVPALASELARLRDGDSEAVAAAVARARRAPGDLAEGLAHLDGAGAKDARAILAAIGELTHIGTTPAVRELVKLAGDHRGAFRPEITRAVRALGDRAVPALLETRVAAPSVRAWGEAELEAMGKRIAGDAVQTPNRQVLIDVLGVFSAIHDLDALPVVLSFVNAAREDVREAARASVVSFGEDARPKLREAYMNLTAEGAPEDGTAADLARALFAAYDRVRLQQVYGLLERGLAAYRAGELDEAVADFDKVLARSPALDRRGEMVPAYLAYAKTLEAGDRARALATLRRARRLAPEGPRVRQIDAELAYLEGEDLRDHGVDDEAPFRRALALDPGHAQARAEIDRLEAVVAGRRQRVRLAGAAAALVLAILVALILLAGRPRAAAARYRS